MADNRCTLRVTAACEAEGGTRTDGASGMCVTCYRACCRLCPECQEPRPQRGRLEGKLKYDYQAHAWEVGSARDCPRCRGPHRTYRVQKVCPACKNERVIFEKPKEKVDAQT